ncbi:hypothetical protein TNCV_4868851 [Trichonephila clavipes]|nr:hypothetical protein TNCV_4868851 [Trichonephila clavipes]
MPDVIRSDIEAHKFHMMSCDISFHSCCKRASNSTKLVGYPANCSNDPRYARLVTCLGIEKAKKEWRYG